MPTPTPIQIQREEETNPEFGDRAWYGVKMQFEPHQIPPNYASQAINMRFNRGVPEARKGVVFLPWLQKIIVGGEAPAGSEFDVWLNGAPVIIAGQTNGEFDVWLDGAPVVEQLT